MFPGKPPSQAGLWLPARGQTLSTTEFPALALLSGAPRNAPNGGPEPGTFELPALTAPGTGAGYYVAATGDWPLGDDPGRM